MPVDKKHMGKSRARVVENLKLKFLTENRLHPRPCVAVCLRGGPVAGVGVLPLPARGHAQQAAQRRPRRHRRIRAEGEGRGAQVRRHHAGIGFNRRMFRKKKFMIITVSSLS